MLVLSLAVTGKLKQSCRRKMNSQICNRLGQSSMNVMKSVKSRAATLKTMLVTDDCAASDDEVCKMAENEEVSTSTSETDDIATESAPTSSASPPSQNLKKTMGPGGKYATRLC